MEFDIKAYSHCIEWLICHEKSQIATYCIVYGNEYISCIVLNALFRIRVLIVSVSTVSNNNLSVIGQFYEIETRFNQVRTIMNL